MKAVRMAGVLLASGAIVAVGVAAAPKVTQVEAEEPALEDPCGGLAIGVVTETSDDDEPESEDEATPDDESSDESETDDSGSDDGDEESDDDPDDDGGATAPAGVNSTDPVAADCGEPFDGPPVSNLRGTYQARIYVSDGVVVDVVAVTAGSTAPESVSVNAMAIPQFRERVLEAQTWDVEAVSGASYTSPAFTESLQGAFEAAGLS